MFQSFVFCVCFFGRHPCCRRSPTLSIQLHSKRVHHRCVVGENEESSVFMLFEWIYDVYREFFERGSKKSYLTIDIDTFRALIKRQLTVSPFFRTTPHIKFNDDPHEKNPNFGHRLRDHKSMENVINGWALFSVLESHPKSTHHKNMENRCLILFKRCTLIMKMWCESTRTNMLTEKQTNMKFLPHQHKVVSGRIFSVWCACLQPSPQTTIEN